MVPTQTSDIEIVVNGEKRTIPGEASVLDVLRVLGIQPERVAVEKDGLIVRKANWAATLVQGGATLEIVQFVGGG
jgi:thiamine biosynthesis protein ThiS